MDRPGPGRRVRLLAAVAAICVIESAGAAGFSVDTIDSAARTLPRLHSLLVSAGGELMFERYYNHAQPGRPANIKSASKSLISALVGIAIERRVIADVRTPIVTFFPELARDGDAAKQKITVEDLLTMRSGLEGTSNRNYGAWSRAATGCSTPWRARCSRLQAR